MTKILPTIGPKTESFSSLKKLSNYTNYFRLNGSHNSLNWHKKIYKRILSINSDAKILLDLPGIKPRTRNNKDIKVDLDQIVVFHYKKFKKNNTLLKIKISNPFPVIKKNVKFFSISDGRHLFKIKKISANYVTAQSVSNFILKPQQGLNFPKSIYNEKKQFKIYSKFLKIYLKEIKTNAIGLSFVQTDNLVKKIKRLFPKLIIISKIENLESLNNIKKICFYSDGIMIDKGDLAAEIGDENLFESIIKINNEVKSHNIPLIMATENLSSMVSRNSPTKSELISLGFSNLLEVDRIMLSEETAISSNWLKIVQWLKNYLDHYASNLKQKKRGEIKFNFWEIFNSIKNIPVILFTKKGYAIKEILKNKEITSLYVFTDNRKLHSLNLLRSNISSSFLTKKFNNRSLHFFLKNNIRKHHNLIFKNCKKAALIYVANPRKNARANTIQFVSYQDFKKKSPIL